MVPDLEHWSTGRLLSTAARLYETSFNHALTGVGVSHAGLSVLRVLEVQEKISQHELAGILHVQPQTMGKTIERLELTQHLFRTRSTADRRMQVVSITDKGRDAVKFAHTIEDSLGAPDDVPVEELRSSLEAIIDQLSSPGLRGRGS
ncbi:MarR family winged helix-turn-helix transcriptional regulator [Arthrobacter sp. AET 35A]|uniref:MarR family winged helix-turn-helix transcriptional regulator n=1 Tax=Arthrobacter sp. AET 35A TaxID=2292643 RepID=UPI0039A67DE7